MTKKILVIGSQGYLGSRLIDYLAGKGYECVGSDIGFFQHGVLYEPSLVKMINKEARTLDEKDLEGFEVVVQLAGISNDPFGNLSPETIYNPTRVYTLRIANICKKLGIQFIFPSSCSVYGIGDGLLDETGPTNPQTPYSLNKLQIEQDLAGISDRNFSPIALRLATVFGASPRIRFDLVINMLCGMAITQKRVVLNSDGQAWRPHVYIDDVCEAFRCCIEWKHSLGSLIIFNIGRNDNNIKVLDVAKLIQNRISGCDLQYLSSTASSLKEDLIIDRKIQDGVDKRTYQVNFVKVHQKLPGYSAKWNVENGIERLIEDLSKWRLDEVKFKQREFYRLQQIEHLYKTNQLDDNLRWLG